MFNFRLTSQKNLLVDSTIMEDPKSVILVKMKDSIIMEDSKCLII